MIIEIIEYKTNSGKIPFKEWLEKLDLPERAIIRTRLRRVNLGNFGDCKKIQGAQGVFELRIDHGPGYRIYFAKQGNSIVLLLIGGTKRGQERDVEKAIEYWNDFQEK